MSANNLDAWKVELSKIQADVEASREVLARGEIPIAQQWVPPRLGRLPRELRPVAEQLRAEVENINEMIQAAMEKNQAERDRLHATPRQKQSSKPIYLDVQG
ncbi:MAG: hypothetical protein SPK50_03450 [Mobiluncus porci]|uniref:Uncharacterized protein n=1 Tax=Mobiluncus porci TaxID=2652278 RepID=A0A7K0K3D5_9ACTO|nr:MULTISPECIES: hypothetical protein [Mobiluncus]MCI6584695.1 hypothetical protein [Mobiluncus sp.]MDD7540998.1 hypothetical protein [Mobiluncus porci]MDY5748173.1 hypothetical protein [Mobiluncus porci]MST49993.1 hypothetical protein [Mobiluncus porci]